MSHAETLMPTVVTIDPDATCAQADIQVAIASGSVELGGSTIVTASPEVEIAPDRYTRLCVTCGRCGISTEVRRRNAGWARFQYPAWSDEERKVQQQCVGDPSATGSSTL